MRKYMTSFAITAMMLSVASATEFKAALGSGVPSTTGQPALAWFTSGISSTATLQYDIAPLGIGGGATKLSLYIESVNGSNLGAGGGNGIAVVSGTVNSWEINEDLKITASLLNISDVDVTADYKLDLVGTALRWRAGAVPMQAVFNGQTVTATLTTTVGFEAFSLPVGQTAETVLNASRTSGTLAAQLAMVSYEIVAVPEPSAIGLACVAALGFLGSRRFVR